MRVLKVGFALASLTVLSAAALSSSTGCGGTGQVRQVFMALDGEGNRPRNQFFSDTSQIFCDVVFSGHGADNTVDISFVQLTGEQPLFSGDGNLQTTARFWAGSEIAPPPGIQTINANLNPPQSVDGGTPEPYPVGHWKCMVSVNGQAAGEAAFDVIYPEPDCPPGGGASNGLPCAAYKNGATCPVVDNITGPAVCTCQPTPDPSARVFVCQ